MTIPRNFRNTAENIIASYSYTDVAEGTGIINFLGMATKDSAATEYVLSQNAYYSSEVESAISGGTAGAFTKYLDLDFDLSSFNLPQSIGGTGIFSIPWGEITTGYSYGAYIIVRVKKNDVELVSVQSDTVNPGGAAANFWDLALLQATIPQTHFKKGDVLRVTIELWASKVGGSSPVGTFYIFHDPKDRKNATATTLGIDTTIIQLGIPFRIDV